MLIARTLLGPSDDSVAIAAARIALQAELSARGEDGKVDVEVDRSEDGRRRVRVQVEAQTDGGRR